MITKLTTTTLRQGQKHALVARLHRILEVLGYNTRLLSDYNSYQKHLEKTVLKII